MASDSNQATLDGRVTVGGQEITAVADSGEADILGWIVPFTIGNDFVVPRDWLEQKATEHGLSQAALPIETSDKRAFTRAGGRVQNRFEASMEREQNIEINLDKIPYQRRYRVEVMDRREENEFDGELIGIIQYDSEHEKLDGKAKIGNSHEMWGAWTDYVSGFSAEFDLMRQSNLGKDIRHMVVQLFRDNSPSVKFRAGGGVYFAPQSMGPIVQAVDGLMDDINEEHKKAGYPCELDAIEIVNEEEKREMVEEKVRRNLESEVSSLLEDAIDELDEDTLVDELVDELEDDLSEVENFAEEYNALLDAEMTVREVLEEWKLQVTGNSAELVEGLIPDEDEDEDEDEAKADPTDERVI